jgi:hypothetical protein
MSIKVILRVVHNRLSDNTNLIANVRMHLYIYISRYIYILNINHVLQASSENAYMAYWIGGDLRVLYKMPHMLDKIVTNSNPQFICLTLKKSSELMIFNLLENFYI